MKRISTKVRKVSSLLFEIKNNLMAANIDGQWMSKEKEKNRLASLSVKYINGRLCHMLKRSNPCTVHCNDKEDNELSAKKAKIQVLNNAKLMNVTDLIYFNKTHCDARTPYVRCTGSDAELDYIGEKVTLNGLDAEKINFDEPEQDSNCLDFGLRVQIPAQYEGRLVCINNAIQVRVAKFVGPGTFDIKCYVRNLLKSDYTIPRYSFRLRLRRVYADLTYVHTNVIL